MIEIKKGERLIIRLSDRLDATNAEAARERIVESINVIDTDVLIDVNDLKYISSAGLQVVLHIAKEAKSAGRQTLLQGAKGEVWEIFKLSGFLTFLKEIK